MLRTLIRFLTRFPNGQTGQSNLLLYETPWQEVMRELDRLRERLSSSRAPLAGYLVNDGSVLAAELVRQLPERPVGYVSMGGAEQRVDSVIEVHTDLLDSDFDWEITVNGVAVEAKVVSRDRLLAAS